MSEGCEAGWVLGECFQGECLQVLAPNDTSARWTCSCAQGWTQDLAVKSSEVLAPGCFVNRSISRIFSVTYVVSSALLLALLTLQLLVRRLRPLHKKKNNLLRMAEVPVFVQAGGGLVFALSWDKHLIEGTSILEDIQLLLLILPSTGVFIGCYLLIDPHFQTVTNLPLISTDVKERGNKVRAQFRKVMSAAVLLGLLLSTSVVLARSPVQRYWVIRSYFLCSICINSLTIAIERGTLPLLITLVRNVASEQKKFAASASASTKQEDEKLPVQIKAEKLSRLEMKRYHSALVRLRFVYHGTCIAFMIGNTFDLIGIIFPNDILILVCIRFIFTQGITIGQTLLRLQRRVILREWQRNVVAPDREKDVDGKN